MIAEVSFAELLFKLKVICCLSGSHGRYSLIGKLGYFTFGELEIGSIESIGGSCHLVEVSFAITERNRGAIKLFPASSHELKT